MNEYCDDDYMEMDSGLVPQEDGWWLDNNTGNRISPEGIVYNKYNECIWDPVLDEGYNFG